jgi:adenylyltransferase/sulfurtransferase
VLCGRNAVQVTPPEQVQVKFEELAGKLRSSGTVTHNAYLLRFTLRDPDYDVTVFRDGRAIVKGTEEMGVARGIYARYVGT